MFFIQKRVYSLFVAISMIVGIVIGSGIYFKVDDILEYTNGNIILGVIVLLIGSLNIIFGSLSLSEMAISTNKSGGILEYYNNFTNKHLSLSIGFFNAFVFLPTLIVVVSWVSGIYLCALLKINNTLENQILISGIVITIFLLLNIFSRYISGLFQSLSTIIKLIPLFLIGILGVLLNTSKLTLPNDFVLNTNVNNNLLWVSALVPIAFAYEGWSIILNITSEIKNPEKNIKKALIIGPLLILISYLIFFLGMCNLLGTNFIIYKKDLSIHYALNSLLGDKLSNVFFIIVIISILGVVNGIILSGIRVPQSLCEKGMLPFKNMKKIHDKLQISTQSALFFSFILFSWLIIHYLTQKYKLLGKSDVSEIAIVFYQIIYIGLYICAIINYKKGNFKNKFTSFYSPIIAIICCTLVVIGSIILSPLYISIFLAFCFIICLISYMYSKTIKL